MPPLGSRQAETWLKQCISAGFTCVFATVQLQVGELEVALVAPWVGTHEGTLLAAVRSDDGRSDAGNAPHVLPTPTKAFLFRVKARFVVPVGL